MGVGEAGGKLKTRFARVETAPYCSVTVRSCDHSKQRGWNCMRPVLLRTLITPSIASSVCVIGAPQAVQTSFSTDRAWDKYVPPLCADPMWNGNYAAQSIITQSSRRCLSRGNRRDGQRRQTRDSTESWPTLKDTDGRVTGKSQHWIIFFRCLPDTVDPRGMKGK